MAVQGALWLAKRYPSILISVFLTGFRYFSYKAATQLSSRGWVDHVPYPILLEKFLGFSRESNPGPLGWQSDVLTTIPNRWSHLCILTKTFRETFLTMKFYTVKNQFNRLKNWGTPEVLHYIVNWWRYLEIFILAPRYRTWFYSASYKMSTEGFPGGKAGRT